MKSVRCVDCHWLSARSRHTRQPFETANTQLREKLKQHLDAHDNYSLKSHYDFSCHEHCESFDDYQFSAISDKVLKERNCYAFSKFSPRYDPEQIKQIEVVSEAIRKNKTPWWRDAKVLIPISVTILLSILIYFLQHFFG
jgi:hypothetical protein